MKVYLKFIPKIGFSQVQEPLLFSDFFLKCFDIGGNLAVLSLNGLFILSTKHNLESKLYYNKLYVLLKQRLSEGKVLKPGFLRLVELSLTSHLLPSALVASFIRLFLREALRASLSQVV
jgi:CBF/Mak21 family.